MESFRLHNEWMERRVGLVEAFEQFLVLAQPEIRMQIVIDERLHHSIADKRLCHPKSRFEQLDGAAALVHIGQVHVRRRYLLLRSWHLRLELRR